MISDYTYREVGRGWPEDLLAPYSARGSRRRWLTLDTKICTIGSCFAVNFSKWIMAHGVDITSPNWGLHYNSNTIKEALSIAYDQTEKSIIWEAFDKTGLKIYLDAKRHTWRAESRDTLNRNRRIIVDSSLSALGSSNAFVITLGLAEVWEQRTANSWEILNRAPLSDHYKEKRPPVRNRFQSVDEIVSDLLHIEAAIDMHAKIPRPIVFTVSPIPLKTTGTCYDVRTANTRSKSLLISAVHEYIDFTESRRGEVYYFPAYEQFLHIGRDEKVWQRDNRHVVATKIDSVCKSFCEVFAEMPAQFDKSINFEVPLV
jgi:hypothetical protein